MGRVQAINNALREKRLAVNRVASELKKHFPVGAPVSWRKGKHVQHGVVTMNTCDDRVEVRNYHTNATLFITAYDIVRAEEA